MVMNQVKYQKKQRIFFQSNEEEYESSIDTENGGVEEVPLVDHEEGEKEEATFDDGDSLPQREEATFISDGIEVDSTQTYAAGNLYPVQQVFQLEILIVG